MEIGTSFLTNGQNPQALQHLLKASELDPYNPLVYNNLGLTYYVMEELSLAITNFKKSVELNSKYTDARNNLGRTLIESGDYKSAIYHLQIAAKDLTYVNPEKTWSNLGYAYFKSNNLKKAKKSLIKALKIKRSHCGTMTLYGRTLFELKTYKSAAKAFDESIGFCAKVSHDQQLYYSALSYYKLGQIGESVSRLKELITKYETGEYNKKAKQLLKVVE